MIARTCTVVGEYFSLLGTRPQKLIVRKNPQVCAAVDSAHENVNKRIQERARAPKASPLPSDEWRALCSTSPRSNSRRLPAGPDGSPLAAVHVPQQVTAWVPARSHVRVRGSIVHRRKPA